MSARADGGPAFPVISDVRYAPSFDHEPGMSLRDYFAAKAMQGMVSSFVNVMKADLPDFLRNLPATSYEIADAMLKAREVQQ